MFISTRLGGEEALLAVRSTLAHFPNSERNIWSYLAGARAPGLFRAGGSA